MTDPKKIAKLFAIIWLTLTWCHVIGQELEKRRPPKMKKHGYRTISTFLLWLRFLSRFFCSSLRQQRDSELVFKFLSCS
jgi:hypothetical protein